MGTLAVIGGGVIGLSTAWRAAEAGWTVTLYDPQIGSGASWVAGGMLAPLSEGWPGEDAAFEFGAASLARWPEFGARLQAVTGADVFTAGETLTVALDSADAADLRTIHDWVNARDLPAFGIPSLPHTGTRDEAADGAAAADSARHGSLADADSEEARRAAWRLRLLDRAGVRESEPGLGRGVRTGLLAASEPAVDNRLLVTALRAACGKAGAELRPEKVRKLADLKQDRIVLATGAAVAKLWPGLPVRPVKGEILRLKRRASAPEAPTRVIRARVHGRPVYLVPRPDGIVLGATQYEAGHDTCVTVAGVRDLITDAEVVFPGIGEYELAEVNAGCRPGSPDNLPLIGHLDERVIAATGHGRNGVLGVPLTAAAVVELLAGGELAEARAANPHRFDIPSSAGQSTVTGEHCVVATVGGTGSAPGAAESHPSPTGRQDATAVTTPAGAQGAALASAQGAAGASSADTAGARPGTDTRQAPAAATRQTSTAAPFSTGGVR